jgi:NTE family protein
MAAKRNGVKKLDLALQGGGAHGAFTWGVLDYFLEQDNLWLEGICGTSAGAVNGVLLAYGLHLGKMEKGRQMAKEKLHAFWKTVSDRSEFSPFRPSWYDKAYGGGNMDSSPGYLMIQMMSQFSSPYEFNPSNINPMRDLLLELVDFDELRNAKDQQVFVCATNVRRGRPKVFPLKEISVDAVLASTCLPYLFQAVTIDGEDYWDGGYMGNPPIFPLIDRTDCGDILIVQINPINIKETPKTANEIQDRINELSFNSSLMLEMRRIASIDKLMEEGAITNKRFKDLRFHVINPEKHIAHLNVSSKMNTDWDYLTWLRDTGRSYAKDWLDANYGRIGTESSTDIRAMYL